MKNTCSKEQTISTTDEINSVSDSSKSTRIEIPRAKRIKRQFCKDVRIKLLTSNTKETTKLQKLTKNSLVYPYEKNLIHSGPKIMIFFSIVEKLVFSESSF